MKLEHTRIVTPGNGPRPAGKPTECFYCRNPLGSPHADTCVLYSKIVMVKVEITIPRVVPAHWGPGDIEFQMNEGSWCSNNIIQDLQRVEAADEGHCRCLCGNFSADYLRDATVEDLDGYTLAKFTEGR